MVPKFYQSSYYSPKLIVKHILNTIEFDEPSTTVANLRKILLISSKLNVDKLYIFDYKTIKYHPIASQMSFMR